MTFELQLAGIFVFNELLNWSDIAFEYTTPYPYYQETHDLAKQRLFDAGLDSWTYRIDREAR